MNSAEQIAKLSRKELRQLVVQGYRIEPEQLSGWAYHGVSLGLPGWLERLTWKTFTKAFIQDEGRVRGWNIKMKQTGEAGPRIPIRSGDAPKRFGAFDVEDNAAQVLKNQFPNALILNYGTPKDADFSLRTLRDPLVALNKDDASLLLGCSWLRILGANFPTPSYFTLQRAEKIEQGRVLWAT